MTEPTIIFGEREAWLAKAAALLAPLFTEHDMDVPRVRVACGWPSRNARPSKRQRIGECWAAAAAEDGIPQLFISPMLRDTVKVLATLLHELDHAAVGTECGHKGAFARLIKKQGLSGKPTATWADTELADRLVMLVVPELGAYPHAALTLVPQERKQSTRLVKAECSECGVIIRITRKWIDQAEEQNGGLNCPMCMRNPMEVAA